MTYKEYSDFKRNAIKEYHYYTHTSDSSERANKMYHYYGNIMKSISEFEKQAIIEFLDKTTVTKDFFTQAR